MSFAYCKLLALHSEFRFTSELSFLCPFCRFLEGIGIRVKTRALMNIASANEDHDHVISVRKYRNLREAVRRVVQMDIGRYNVIGFQRLFTGSLPCFIPH